jgi:hypothetical protein
MALKHISPIPLFLINFLTVIEQARQLTIFYYIKPRIYLRSYL